MKLTVFCLLAGNDAWKHLGDKFRKGGPSVTGPNAALGALVIGIVAVAIYWIVRLALRRLEQRRKYDPRMLFAELCRAHALERAQQRLLRAIANWHELTHWSEVFIEPRYLAEAAADAAFQHRGGEIRTLQTVLFAASADTSPR